ncbi:Spy/CpxP family protein refolding chaperone [Dictyoglomus thermophilum]|uniref:MlpD n=1 Tax=Dictyoglomus thermophilum (strain ATCC 35947 / DSM 3960 / H-6-12) TaxID=309799 RepID=B5YDE9_DICT6|nr:MlpD [Dictyoglomus thermophilum]ACI18856.1 MlpD [Dictyoglomus thermophilum H-6-12]
MRKIIKIFAVILVILVMFLSFSYASPFRGNPLILKERTRLQFSQEYRNLIRERDRIEAQIQLLLRSGKVDSEELQKYLGKLKDLDDKIYTKFKKDLIDDLSKVLKLKEEQIQKVEDLLNKYLDEIRNLRIQLRDKNLEMRTLEENQQDRQKELREEIYKIKNEIRDKQKTMFKELKQVLDQEQFRILVRLMQRYNIRIRIKVF